MSEEFELSEREIDIIRLVATGASNKEIAQKLVISPNTVKVHLRNIFAKLNVMSRTEATMVAISRGWVESPKSGNLPDAVPVKSENAPIISGSPLGASKKPSNTIIIALVVLMVVLASILLWNNRRLARLAEQNSSQINISNATRWQSISPLPSGLNAMAYLRYEQSFYLFGGSRASGVTGEVNILDINSDHWSQGRQKPHPASHIQAASLGEKIYAPGGTSDDGMIMNVFEVYDPRDDRWESRANLPAPISRYGLVSYEGKLYLFGGWDGNQYRSEVLVYDPAVDAWQQFDQLPVASADFGVAVVGGVIHIFGGVGSGGVLDSHLLFFPQRRLDGENPWKAARALPEARYGMGLSVLADMVYIAGGLNAEGDLLPIIQYLPPRDEWVQVDQPPEAIGSLPAVLPYEARLFVIGGQSGATYQRDSQVYQAIYTILVPIIQQ